MGVHIMHVASFFAIASSLVLLSVSFAPWWLVGDGHHPNETFQRIGLWQVCFKQFCNESLCEYSTHCAWIFNEHDLADKKITLPGFFIATQTLFTFSIVSLILICLPALARYFYVRGTETTKVMLLFIISGCMCFSAVCGTAAVTVFGTYCEDQQWIPNIEHKNVGTAYQGAVTGIFFLWIATLLVFLQTCEQRGNIKSDQQFSLIDENDFSIYTL